ncbi:YkvA family protein [Brevibacillus ruminantium]|uniref:YkvA family protein n=1 Tax=Brevibacillus ruminantium TaxID=2950604 RepID=A0ABY4WF31_9BACL|nr:YkvA family protein [Brevibacillus ruminantium]USG65499.1 YkvA family protein [Brevibacillus ruminantium]
MSEKYAKAYSEESFWKKVKKFAKKAGGKVVYVALLLYYALQNPKTPAWAKTVILGALGYFISPLDIVPDVTPVVGYGDDLTTLIGALVMVAVYIDEEVKGKARSKLTDWFGTEVLPELEEIDEKLNKKKEK